jgi:hypothetical protein
MDRDPFDRIYGMEGMGGAPDPTNPAWILNRQLHLLERQRRADLHHAHVQEVIHQQIAELPGKVLREVLAEHKAQQQPKKSKWFRWFK